MPEVFTSLSLLLLFIGIGLDRGVLTVVLAHTTFAMCYVSVVVSSRLATLDRSLEEAALDLGCSQFDAFRLVTLPIKVFSAVRLGVSPEINALSTLLIAIVTCRVITASLMSKRAATAQARDEQAAAREG